MHRAKGVALLLLMAIVAAILSVVTPHATTKSVPFINPGDSATTAAAAASIGLISKTLTAKRRYDFIEAGIRASPEAVHELVFAVNQLNLDKLEKELIDRATPESALYQQWLTFDEIGNMVTNKPAYEKVSAWLASIPGVTVTKTTARLEYITATASVATWEAALNTQFHVWNDLSKQSADGKPFLFTRCKDYSFPAELGGALDHIFNTVQVPPRLNKRNYAMNAKETKTTADAAAQPKTNFRAEEATCTPLSGFSLATPAFLNNLYDITSNVGSANMQQAVFETGNEYFSPNDLSIFQNNYGLPVQSCSAPNGFYTPSCSTTGTGNDCFYGNLDVQYMMAIAQKTPTIYYYVDGTTNTDPFVQFVTDLATTPNPPDINSISWGELETNIDITTANSFNTEAMKLGALGVTVTVSSGDNGAPGQSNINGKDMCLCSGVTDPTTGLINSGYNPTFPASSPWVTAVGATQGPTCGLEETVCSGGTDGVITSGGGFSALYTAPTWQTSVIASYFTKQTPVEGYNTIGRGYPDISLLGVDYPVVVDGATYIMYGTTASSPVFAAMLTLVNSQRVASGLPKVGFINPTLYAAASASLYTDIISGNNNCCSGTPASPTSPAVPAICCNTGFGASKNWDPATGFGSITLKNLMNIFTSPAASPSQPPTSMPSHLPSPTYAPSMSSTPVLTTASSSVVPTPTTGSFTPSPNSMPTTTAAPTVSQQQSDANALCAFKAGISNWPGTCAASITSGWNCNGIIATSVACTSLTSTWSGVSCFNNAVLTLSLANCGFNGAISSHIANLTKIEKINLSSNSLASSIPAQISELSALVSMYLNNNQLTGPAGSFLCTSAMINSVHSSLQLQLNQFSCIASCVRVIAGPGYYDASTPVCLDSPTYAPSMSSTPVPTTAPIATVNPTFAPTNTKLLFSYSVYNTDFDTQNHATVGPYDVCASTFTATACDNGGSFIGNTYFRLVRSNGTQLASNDDSCGTGSKLQYTAATCTTVYLWLGCYGSGACSATVAILYNYAPVPTLSPSTSLNPTVPSKSTKSPTMVPTASPTISRKPTLTPSVAPTAQQQSDANALCAFKQGITNWPGNSYCGISYGWTCDGTNAIAPYPCDSSSVSWSGVSCGASGQVNGLVLNSCGFSGAISSQLFTMIGLQYLRLSNNALSSSIPSQLSLSTGLQYLALSENYFTGQIPSEISILSSLNTLDLSYNYISGRISSQLSTLTGLQYFYLSNNSLSGTIPTQISTMSILSKLDLSFNYIRGEISPQLLSLTSLQDLYLTNNFLSGRITSQLSKLKGLQYLYLSNNTLSGQIPTQISTLSQLQHLALDNNTLTGAVGTSICIPSIIRGYVIIAGNTFSCINTCVAILDGNTCGPYTYDCANPVTNDCGTPGAMYTPTLAPTLVPNMSPMPTFVVTMIPTANPLSMPSVSPTVSPIIAPTAFPSSSPTDSTSVAPNSSPTHEPSVSPSEPVPSLRPSQLPSRSPSQSPTFLPPTIAPTRLPTPFPVANSNQSSILPSGNKDSTNTAVIVSAVVAGLLLVVGAYGVYRYKNKGSKDEGTEKKRGPGPMEKWNQFYHENDGKNRAEYLSKTAGNSDPLAADSVDSNSNSNPIHSNGPDQSAATATSNPPDNRVLPDGWKEKIDPRTGDKYYVNSQTKASRWDFPAAASETESSASQMESGSTFFNNPLHGKVNSPSKLPEGWKEKVDPSTGKTYYANSTKRVTQWERPSAAAIVPQSVHSVPVESTSDSKGSISSAIHHDRKIKTNVVKFATKSVASSDGSSKGAMTGNSNLMGGGDSSSGGSSSSGGVGDLTANFTTSETSTKGPKKQSHKSKSRTANDIVGYL